MTLVSEGAELPLSDIAATRRRLGTTVRFANHLASLWLVEVIPVETRTASPARARN
jgi:hypothetical protein